MRPLDRVLLKIIDMTLWVEHLRYGLRSEDEIILEPLGELIDLIEQLNEEQQKRC